MAALVSLAATKVWLDREEEARTHTEELLRMEPKFSVEWVRQLIPTKDPAHLERWLSALRKTGLK